MLSLQLDIPAEHQAGVLAHATMPGSSFGLVLPDYGKRSITTSGLLEVGFSFDTRKRDVALFAVRSFNLARARFVCVLARKMKEGRLSHRMSGKVA